MEVKLNKTNNQKYVSIPKYSSLNEGDEVKIMKVEFLSKLDVKSYFEKNKEKFIKLKKDLFDYFSMDEVSPENLFIENFRKLNDIKESREEFDHVFYLRKTMVMYDIWADELSDCDNFAQANPYLKFESVLEEDEEGYTFDENKFTKENLIDSAILTYYINLKVLSQKMEFDAMKEIYKEAGFIEDPQGHDEYAQHWINEENQVRLVVSSFNEKKDVFYAHLEPIKNKEYPNRIEVEITI
jgi:hypothetical protein